MKFLCAVLNSRLATWFMENAALTSGMGVTRWFSTSVSSIPVPRQSPEKQLSLVRLVDRSIAAKKADPNAAVTGNMLRQTC